MIFWRMKRDEEEGHDKIECTNDDKFLVQMKTFYPNNPEFI